MGRVQLLGLLFDPQIFLQAAKNVTMPSPSRTTRPGSDEAVEGQCSSLFLTLGKIRISLFSLLFYLGQEVKVKNEIGNFSVMSDCLRVHGQ